MKPLNSQERTKQFFIFLAFFIVTIALAVGAVYFPIENNPKKHNDILKVENKKLKIQQEVNDKLLKDIDSLYSQLTKISGMKSSQMKVALPVAADLNARFKSSFASEDGENVLLSKYSDIFTFSLTLLNENQKLIESKEECDKQTIAREKLETEFNNYKRDHPL
jgi:hypothetical protein